MLTVCECVCDGVVLEHVRQFQQVREEDFSKLQSSQRCTADDRWRIQTPLVSPKEKAARSAPPTSDSRQQRCHKGERCSLDPLIIKLLINNLCVPDHLLLPLSSLWSWTCIALLLTAFPVHLPIAPRPKPLP